MSTESILNSVLLSLQLCLGFWQIGKLTPVGAIIQCGVGWLVSKCLLPLGLSTAYSRLECFEGQSKLWKKVRCHVTIQPDQPTMPRQVRSHKTERQQSSYLGVEFHLEKRGDNKLYLNEKMSYYITDPIWHALLDFAQAAPATVFLKGYKEFWQAVATGGVMTLSDVLDSLILENHTIKVLDNDLLLPVNLSISEEKILKALNLAGLFLQTRRVYWVIPTLLSFTAALLEFSTSVRAWLYCKINLFFCQFMHISCDRLPRSMRRQVYSLGNWMENLKPSNDLRLRVVKGKMCAVIGGGAKVQREGATPFQVNPFELSGSQEDFKISCGNIDSDYPPIDIECSFEKEKEIAHVKATTVADTDVYCTRDEFAKLYNFLNCVAKNCSGSLKSCDSNTKARVRGFRDCVTCYSRNGFPTVYELKLDNVVVE